MLIECLAMGHQENRGYIASRNLLPISTSIAHLFLKSLRLICEQSKVYVLRFAMRVTNARERPLNS